MTKHSDVSDFMTGDRVEINPGSDLWMRGARFGTVKKIGTKKVHVHMDAIDRVVALPPWALTLID